MSCSPALETHIYGRSQPGLVLRLLKPWSCLYDFLQVDPIVPGLQMKEDLLELDALRSCCYSYCCCCCCFPYVLPLWTGPEACPLGGQRKSSDGWGLAVSLEFPDWARPQPFLLVGQNFGSSPSEHLPAGLWKLLMKFWHWRGAHRPQNVGAGCPFQGGKTCTCGHMCTFSLMKEKRKAFPINLL